MSALDHSKVTAFDQMVDDALDSLRGNRTADRTFYALSEAANHSKIWHAAAWVPIFYGRRTWREAAVISLALGAESALVNGGIKQLFRRQRPVVSESRPHALRQPKTSSFPSGHATSAFFALCLMSTRRWRGPWLLLASAVAVSRAYVRIHHASDVVGGIAVGLGLGQLAKRLLRASLR